MCLFDATVNKGELTVRLSEVIDLAPVAQVIVYSVMANGEIVADSQDFPIQLCLSNKVGNTKMQFYFLLTNTWRKQDPPYASL